MTDLIPTRLRTLFALTDLLKTITIENGYQHDMADSDDAGRTVQRVFRGRNSFGDGDPLPMLAILENPHANIDTVESPRGAQMVKGPWDLLVQGFVEDDKVNPTDPAHMLMADVKLCLVRERMKIQSRRMTPGQDPAVTSLLGMSGVVDDIKIAGGVVRPPDETSAKAMFWLQVTLEMIEDISNPFA